MKKEQGLSNMKAQFMTFTCPLPPSVNEYLGKRVAFNPITRKNFVQVYETSSAKAFKKHMAKVLERAVNNFKWEKTGEYEYVICDIHVYSNQKRKDADNMFKCLLDSFTENGLIYDDSMVMPRVTQILIDKENPRLEVFLKTSGKVGVFPSCGEYEEFIGNYCSKCTRYSRNCSILRESTENRVRAEIFKDDYKNYRCKNFKEKKGV